MRKIENEKEKQLLKNMFADGMIIDDKVLEELAEYKAEEKSISKEFYKLGAMTVKAMSEEP